MPHYKDGSPAKVGDLIKHVPSFPNNAAHALGILVAITSASDACNGQLYPLARKWPGSQWLPVLPVYQECVTLKDCLRLDTEIP